jgi:hypothetical protein
MATGRISRKVLDHIAQINRENEELRMSKNLKKEVETGKHGTQKYVIKQGENKGKVV